MFVLFLLVSFFALSCSKDRPAPVAPAGKSLASLAAPPAPTNLRFDAPTDSSCTVRWDASDGATDYDVNYKLASGGRWTNEPHTGDRLYNTIHDLEPDTEYRWAVRAENSDGVSEWIHGPNFTTLPDDIEGDDNVDSDQSSEEENVGETVTESSGSPESDRAALEEFYQHVLEAVAPSSGRIEALTEHHWMSRSTIAKWRGIMVNAEGRVIEVSLPCHELWKNPGGFIDTSTPTLATIKAEELAQRITPTLTVALDC